jgi:hypothetical protein
MKNILLILSVIILASCSSDDNSGDIQDQFENIKTIVPQGTWAVSNYTEGETNKTSNFENFVFTFNGNGTVVGANDLFSENGTWEYDNTSTVEERFNLEFDQTTPFDLITENWMIISVNNNLIELAIVNGNNGEPEILTFVKL